MFKLLYNLWHSRMCSYCLKDAKIKVVTHENKTKYICPDCWRSIRFREYYYFKKAEDIPYKYKKNKEK